MEASRLLSVVICVCVFASSAYSESLVIMETTKTANGYQSKALCSIRCTAPRPPDSLKVTFFLNTLITNIELMDGFQSTQDSMSMMWHVQNTRTYDDTGDGFCLIEVKLTYTRQTSSGITGSCVESWQQPTFCPFDYSSSAVSYLKTTCDSIVDNALERCYNQTVISICCIKCLSNQFSIQDCSFGDLDPYCDNLHNSACYDSTTEENCCRTCHLATYDYDHLPNCKYGDHLSTCSYLQRHQCYTSYNDCCEQCFYLADPTTPDCTYGDRRPNFCQDISISDCYNATVEFYCCHTCKTLRTDIDGCVYGDRDILCYSIKRNDCYNQTIRDLCCESCPNQMSSVAGCEYGDRRSCNKVTRYDCSRGEDYWCCETCAFLQKYGCKDRDASFCENFSDGSRCYTVDVDSCCYTCLQYFNPLLADQKCAFGDQSRFAYRCLWLSTFDCYNSDWRHTCCDTCASLRINGFPESCAYGDLKPSFCDTINRGQCYNADIATDCCETCHWYGGYTAVTDCQYGDHRNCSNLKPFRCYNDAERNDCCETCVAFDESIYYGEDCKYGNKVENCYTEDIFRCYDDHFRDTCCMFCQNVEKNHRLNCEFGDKRLICKNITSAEQCYLIENNDCCETCLGYQVFLPIDDCQYGNRGECSDVALNDCDIPSIKYACCQTCYYKQLLDVNTCYDKADYCHTITVMDCYKQSGNCCATCKQYQSGSPANCPYGDRTDSCSTILPLDCYDDSVAHECCRTCDILKRTDLPYLCRYGDMNSTCSDVYFHGSECYNEQVQLVCCEACSHKKTGISDCLYGDHRETCSSIAMSECYIGAQEDICCSTCAEYAEGKPQDCPYGDRISGCLEHQCAEFPTTQPLDCCHTCRNYASPTTPETSSSTAAVPSDTEKSSSSTIPIIGGTVGGVVLVSLLAVIVVVVLRRRRRNDGNQKHPHSNGHLNPAFPAPSGPFPTAPPRPQHTYLQRPQQQRPSPQGQSWQPYPPQGKQQIPANGANANQAQNGPKSNQQVKAGPRSIAGTVKSMKSGKANEEVYDYIDLDDVKTVASFPPAPRPALPNRPVTSPGYVEPVSVGNQRNYDNKAFVNDAQNNAHTYHILQRATAPPASQYSSLS